MCLISRLVFFGVMASTISMLTVASAGADLAVTLSVSGPEQPLKSWDAASLSKLKASSSDEKNPATGKSTHYKGVLLGTLIDQAMADVPLDRKAQVDLLILKNASGGQVLLPRSVVTKYPVLLALNEGKVSIVMPWTSKPKIMNESLPIESYFVPELTRIELSNYRERFGSVFLKRRTDPLAMRGEKLFVQTCVGCHADKDKPSVSDLSADAPAHRLASSGHPAQVKGVPKLDERDRRAVVNYLEMYRHERTSKAASPFETSRGPGATAEHVLTTATTK